MNKVYLVVESCANDNINETNIYVYDSYDKAKEKFEEEKQLIISFDLGYDTIEDEKDSYCEYDEGYYRDYHELVYIEEKEVR